MTYTNTAANFFSTDRNHTQLIHMPSRFTSTEANFYKRSLKQFYSDSESIVDDSSNLAIKKTILDFGKTTFIDSEGLLGLCQILLLVKGSKNDLSFLNFSPQVKLVLSLAGLEHMFPIENQTNK